VFANISIFRESEDKAFVAKIVPLLNPVLISQGEWLWDEGSYSDGIYFISEGRVNFVKAFKIDNNR
jgi:CRP-like cAMP-binding protein